jgi:hypothetical protein
VVLYRRFPGNRDVSIFDPASVSQTDPARPWSRLPLGDNIRFVGTVNFDETTKPISQRMLDRADLLRLEPGPLPGGKGRASTSSAKASGDPITLADVQSWIYDDRPFEPAAAQVLEAMQAPLKALGCPLTPRRLGAIGFYHPPPNRVFSDRAGGIHLRDYISRAGLNYKLDWGNPAKSRYLSLSLTNLTLITM